MSSESLRIGLIGIGRIAQAHLDAALRLREHVSPVAFCSRNEVNARRAADRAGGGRIYVDYRALVADNDIDAVVVSTPHDLHHEVCLAAIDAGKHVLVEKPMTRTAREAEELVAAARTAGLTLMVAQSRRFPDSVDKLFSLLSELGEIFRLHVLFLVSFPSPPTDWWRSAERAGGLVIMLQGSHALDSVLWWKGEAPREVYAKVDRRNDAWEGEDEADIFCAFAGGATASVHLSLNTTPPLHESLIVGDHGRLRLIEYPTGRPFGFGYRLEHNGSVVFEEAEARPYLAQLREFAAAVREGRPPLASGAEILPVMRTLDAARRSARTGRPERL
ncbi:MAG: Gfo/Idh/MocA family protein [Alphaproteobacteria bacterium]